MRMYSLLVLFADWLPLLVVNSTSHTTNTNMNTAHTVTDIINLIVTEATQLSERVGVEVHPEIYAFLQDYIQGGKRSGINEQSIENGGFYLVATNFTMRNGYEIDVNIICTLSKSPTWQRQGTRRIVIAVPK